MSSSLAISSSSLRLTHVFPTNGNAILFNAISSCRISSLKPPSLNSIFIRIPYGSFKKASFFTSSRPFSPVMEWQDCTAKMEIDVPASVAYKCYSDREAIPNWMPFISSVQTVIISLETSIFDSLCSNQVLEDKPDLSRWSLKYKAFGRDIEYSWLARNMQPIPNQKIHWRSLEGLPNRQAKKQPSIRNSIDSLNNPNFVFFF
ncbi:Polyketide cyclase/dehydrase and lipid transport superfamily protein [Gossypium australe]|uniref:Polyketide cyclase/dehydrase and lipid transport superfamily protein n=1 Tax=Gossypium australe TaxID=47621 RepID=A0A5B6W2T4_9ROSI|nr:Polyketide cyclase/dehydrase and lipid transport superfamily protein [Gossypium australe]